MPRAEPPSSVAGLAERRELGDVGSRDERALARTLEHDRAHARVVIEPVELGLELLEEWRRERVDGRVVDGDGGDVAVLLRRDELGPLRGLR